MAINAKKPIKLRRHTSYKLLLYSKILVSVSLEIVIVLNTNNAKLALITFYPNAFFRLHRALGPRRLWFSTSLDL